MARCRRDEAEDGMDRRDRELSFVPREEVAYGGGSKNKEQVQQIGEQGMERSADRPHQQIGGE